MQSMESVQVTADVTVVPEPGAWARLIISLLLIAIGAWLSLAPPARPAISPDPIQNLGFRNADLTK